MLAAIALTATLVAGCSSTPDSSPGPASSAPSAPTATAVTTATPTPRAPLSGTPGPSATPTAAATCEPFGTTWASASSGDWSADLSATFWGATMRLGVHDCYERWVLEFDGRGEAPGWSVTPHTAVTFTVDPSGEALAPPLAGAASLEVRVGAWYDGTPLGESAYAGPMTLTGAGAIREARIISGFEGMTQIGLGLDRTRPFRVTWLDDPARLVVDVFAG